MLVIAADLDTSGRGIRQRAGLPTERNFSKVEEVLSTASVKIAGSYTNHVFSNIDNGAIDACSISAGNNSGMRKSGSSTLPPSNYFEEAMTLNEYTPTTFGRVLGSFVRMFIYDAYGLPIHHKIPHTLKLSVPSSRDFVRPRVEDN